MPLHSDFEVNSAGISILCNARRHGALPVDHGIQFHGVQSRMEDIRVTGKLGFSNHPMLEHFKFLKAHT
jgi:hypothetical protein